MLCLLLLSPILVNAQEGEDEYKLKKEKDKSHRMPEADYLEYRYENEGIYLYLCMYYETGILSITGVDNSFSLSSEVCISTGDYVYTGTLKGTYTITVVTDTETAFSGIITIK